jgi:uncharacterized damage-inducible protein DinB
MTALLIEDFRRDRDEALALFAADAAALAQPYAPGKWSGRHVLLHLTDANSVLLDRLRRLQADPKPLLWAFDQDAWAQHLHYPRRDLKTAAALFAATIDTIAELAALVPAERFERAGVHNEIGRKTFAEVIAFIHDHTQHHLGQVRAAVQGRIWGGGVTEKLTAYYQPPAR